MDWAPVVSVAITGIVGIGGVLLGGYFTKRTEQRRVANEDERRWLADRRHVYATYLALITSMLRSIDSMSSFLPSEGKAALPDAESILKD